MKLRFVPALILVLLFATHGASCAAKQEPLDLKAELTELLENNPDVLLDFLNEHSVELLEIVQAGAEKKRVLAMRQQWQAELANPRTPAIEVGRPMMGRPDAPVTVVEYSDFQCPYCGRASQALEEALQKYGDKVRVLFKHLPLDIHKYALLAAKYFEAAGLQGPDKAWGLYYALFGNQQALQEQGEDFIKQQAEGLGLNMKKLAEDVESQAVMDRIKADEAEAKKYGFNGTPMFLVNGVLIGGAVPAAQFEELIDLVLEQQAK